MRDIFLTSSALILIISVLRYFLHGKIAPRLQYALWLLVAARLLIPGFLFTTPVGMMGITEKLPETVQAASPDIPVLPQSWTASENAAVPVQTDSVSQQTPDAGLTADWSGIVWKTGMVVTGGTMLLSNLRFAAALRRKRRLLALPVSVETGRLPVYLVEDLPSPCLFGFFQPAIYINEQALDPASLPYILAHERTHFRHGDHFWVLLRTVCLTLHWYNPLVWLAAALCRRDCELACDDGVIWLLGEQRRLDYGAVLLRMVSSGRPSLLNVSTSMSAGKRNLKERIMLIAQRPQMLKLTMAAVALVMCGAVTMTFGGAETVDSRLPENPQNTETRPQVLSSGSITSAEYTHFSGLFSLTMPDNWPESVIYVESEDGVAFFEANSLCWLMTVVPEPVEWVEDRPQSGIRLAEFQFNGDRDNGGSPYFYMLDWNREPDDTEENRLLNASLLEQREALAASFRLLATADIFSQLVHSSYEANLPLAITYLPYLSWNNYRTLYGEDALCSLLSAVSQFAGTGEADWGQYHDIMSNRTDRAIEGTSKEAYQEMIWSLYRNNPRTFVSVLDSIYLTESERANMLYWSRIALPELLDGQDPAAASDQEIHDILTAAIPPAFP